MAARTGSATRRQLLGGVALPLAWSVAGLAHAAAADPAARVGRLAARVERLEGLRAIKRLQYAYAHYCNAGLWNEAAALFAPDAVATIEDNTFTGRDAIRRYLVQTVGEGREGLAEGRLHTAAVLSQVVNIEPGGDVAKGRWREVAMLGHFGKDASWSGGIYENTYVRQGGVWRIKQLHYYPRFRGPYDGGWRSAETKPTVVPFHYDSRGAGVLIPGWETAAARPTADLAGLEGRLRELNDAAEVERLQNAYGFYTDRKMWDDVADLFADDATFELAQNGVYVGKARIRAGLEQFGTPGPHEGELNDHLQLEPLITVAADGRTARARLLQMTMTGKNNEWARWGLGVAENSYVKQGGVWKIAGVRVYSRLSSDYDAGWAKSALPALGPSAKVPPDRPPQLVYANYPKAFSPPFETPHPVTAKPARQVSPAPPRDAAELQSRLAEAERLAAVVEAYDGAQNVSNAYGYDIDEFLWDATADLFAKDGWKELSYIGVYVGRERVRQSMVGRYGSRGRTGAGMTLHQKTQAVVHPSHDGQSAAIRERLFQMNSAIDAQGSYIGGVYENLVVKEDGVWKIQGMDLDYTWTSNYANGWGKVASDAARRFAPQTGANKDFPPDRPLRGVIYPPYPGLPDQAFHYRNPVSGRAPPTLLGA